MPLTEAKLVFFIALFLCMDALVSRQRIVRFCLMFPLACVTGWLAQLALGPGMNLYTPNISLYVSYVSVAVILAWGVGLTSMWALQIALCRFTRGRPNLLLFLLSAVPSMLILEYIGSNVLIMRLHDFHRYQPLMPSLNSMRAPVWLYGYYALIAILFYAMFYAMLTALRINTGDWSRARRPRLPSVAFATRKVREAPEYE